jgi:hypothetical protein
VEFTAVDETRVPTNYFHISPVFYIRYSKLTIQNTTCFWVLNMLSKLSNLTPRGVQVGGLSLDDSKLLDDTTS